MAGGSFFTILLEVSERVTPQDRAGYWLLERNLNRVYRLVKPPFETSNSPRGLRLLACLPMV
jgi:hypothetical protein